MPSPVASNAGRLAAGRLEGRSPRPGAACPLRCPLPSLREPVAAGRRAACLGGWRPGRGAAAVRKNSS